MKEDPDEVQKKMSNEQGDNIKLAPILKEAYELLVKIEKIRTDAVKRCRQLEKEKVKLKKKREHLSGLTTVEDQAAHSKELYKTIMCPLHKTCPKDNRDRFPKSDISNVTQFGTQCPYAHHPMELRFP